MFAEIVGIHRCERVDAVALLARVLNGCNVICGDSTAEMTRAKELLLKQSYAKELRIYSRWAFVEGGWVQRTLSMDAQGKPIAEKHETVLLAFSPSITVGVSWERTTSRPRLECSTLCVSKSSTFCKCSGDSESLW